MNSYSLAAALALFASIAPAQVLQNNTQGTVPRIPMPNIQPCSTAPEPYYYNVFGTVSRTLGPNEEIRLMIKPILLNGGPIFGCEWISQCLRPVPDAQGNITGVAQFGTNNIQRSWYSGMQAEALFAIVDKNAGVGTCVADPRLVSVATSNVTRINIDPTIPTLFDHALPCRRNFADVQGVPSPGSNLTWTLPAPGGVAFGALDAFGYILFNCQFYMLQAAPLVFISTDAQGVLSFNLPNDPGLSGANVSTQSLLISGGQIDLTQPTYVSIR